jgi:HEAT repeat protein
MRTVMKTTHFFLALSLFGAAPAWAVGEGKSPIQQVECSVDSMINDVRIGLKKGSPAYKKYLKNLLREAAPGIPFEQLRSAFDQERDPEMVEALGGALAARSSRNADPQQISPVLARINRESDPASKAAALRGLRGIGSVEAIGKIGGLSYEQLMRDPSPEVREAVVGNLIEENSKIYFGHDKAVSETAVTAALHSNDPKLASKLLHEVSMEKVGHQTVQQLSQNLHTEDPIMREATVKALGGVPGAESATVRNSILDLYRTDNDPQVRKTALESIARLGMGGSIATLESLRSVDPSMSKEIDTWITVLKKGLQEWSLVEREKQRLLK